MSYETVENETASRTVRARRLVRRENHLPFVPYGLLPGAGLLLALLFALWPFAGAVQQAALNSAEASLAAHGIDWAEVSVDGQCVTLTGAPPSQEARRLAEKVVREGKSATPFGLARPVRCMSVREIASVADTLPADGTAPEAPAPEPDASLSDWTFGMSHGVLKLDGTVPDAGTRNAIRAAARERIDPPRITSVEDNLKLGDGRPPQGYLPVALRGIATVSQCDAGTARLRAGAFSLQCELPAGREAAVRAEADADLPYGKFGAISIVTHEAVETCEGNLAGLLGDARIEFDSASAVISVSSNALLDQVAAAAKACPGTLRIEGHTDSTGPPDANVTLSSNRAYAVRNALVARGVEAPRLIAEGFGAERPIAVNTTPAGRARNRRIEIRVVRASE
ncbi:MAG: OmpA family protein [Hyphomonas sp.]|nr:OmpA family protein [Hyphomonas sp.]